MRDSTRQNPEDPRASGIALGFTRRAAVGAGLLANRGDRRWRWSAGGGVALLVASVLVFVLRPDFDASDVATDQPAGTATPRGRGEGACPGGGTARTGHRSSTGRRTPVLDGRSGPGPGAQRRPDADAPAALGAVGGRGIGHHLDAGVLAGRNLQHHLAAAGAVELGRGAAVDEDGHPGVAAQADIAVGVDLDGIKHVLGIWVQAKEGAAFWASVCAELANRGVKDVLIVACDGLTGLSEAIAATWPFAEVQTCVVHLIRASMRFVSYSDRKNVAKALKPIYTAANAEAARAALEAFAESPLGAKYPTAVRSWEAAWERFIPFLAFGPATRKLIYTTNSIESLNYQLRKITKNRGHFPSDAAAIKLLWLAIRNIEDRRDRERDAVQQVRGVVEAPAGVLGDAADPGAVVERHHHQAEEHHRRYGADPVEVDRRDAVLGTVCSHAEDLDGAEVRRDEGQAGDPGRQRASREQEVLAGRHGSAGEEADGHHEREVDEKDAVVEEVDVQPGHGAPLRRLHSEPRVTLDLAPGTLRAGPS